MTKFKEVLDQNNLRPIDIAYSINVSEATVYSWMSGRRSITISNVVALQNFFDEKEIDVNVIDIFTKK